jgi:hypothetical protein
MLKATSRVGHRSHSYLESGENGTGVGAWVGIGVVYDLSHSGVCTLQVCTDVHTPCQQTLRPPYHEPLYRRQASGSAPPGLSAAPCSSLLLLLQTCEEDYRLKTVQYTVCYIVYRLTPFPRRGFRLLSSRHHRLKTFAMRIFSRWRALPLGRDLSRGGFGMTPCVSRSRHLAPVCL